MDPIRNPYAPGAGTRPPELAGRDEIREKARIGLERARIGRSSKSLLLVGLRGVGKTVLLDRIREDAEATGIYSLRVEASENRSLPSILAPQLRTALLKLSNREAAKQLAQHALRALAGFVGALKVKYDDIEVGLDFDPEPGLADNGDLETDLQTLLEAVGAAAKAETTCVALFVDELQYVNEDELAALITALHRTAQRQLPVIMLGAGLPQVRGRMGKAKSYAERLFEFPEIGALSTADAKRAISKPAQAEGVTIEDDALEAIIDQTRCYPYFLQEWVSTLGMLPRVLQSRPPMLLSHCNWQSPLLDASFFLVRFDRLTPSEKKVCAGHGATWRRSASFRRYCRRIEPFS